MFRVTVTCEVDAGRWPEALSALRDLRRAMARTGGPELAVLTPRTGDGVGGVLVLSYDCASELEHATWDDRFHRDTEAMAVMGQLMGPGSPLPPPWRRQTWSSYSLGGS